MKADKIVFFMVYTLLAVGCGGIIGSMISDRQRAKHEAEIVRDTIWDTTRVVLPVAKDSAVVRYIVVPIKKDTGTNGIYAQNQAEFMHGEPCQALSVDSDGAGVVLPIEQKHYGDSTYDAWVSGYMARLDSINVYRRTIENTVIVKTKTTRWNVGLVGGDGYGMSSRRVEPFVGVGISYRLYPP